MTGVTNPKTYHVVKVKNTTDKDIYVMIHRFKPNAIKYFFIDPDYYGKFIAIKNRIRGLTMNLIVSMMSKNAIFYPAQVVLIDPYTSANMKYLLGYGEVEIAKENANRKTPFDTIKDNLDEHNDNVMPLPGDENEIENGEETNPGPSTANEMKDLMNNKESGSEEIPQDLLEELSSKSIEELKEHFKGKINFRSLNNKSKIINKILVYLKTENKTEE